MPYARTRITHATCEHINLRHVPEDASEFVVPTERGDVQMIWCKACTEKAKAGQVLTNIRLYLNNPSGVSPARFAELKREFWSSLIRIAMSKEFADKGEKQ